MHGTEYVFAATDRPAIVHERNGKLVYSPVNESNVTMLCSFSTEPFPGALAMAKDDCLMVAQIDAIQKLHIRCVSCGNHRLLLGRRVFCTVYGPPVIPPSVAPSMQETVARDASQEPDETLADKQDGALTAARAPRARVRGATFL
jgi:hypothetical protein